MVYKKKSWQEKLADKNNLPKVLKLQRKFPCYNAVHKMGADVGDDVFQQVAPAVRGIGVHECGQGVDTGDIFFTRQGQDAGAELLQVFPEI